jgi:hypothetical protein
MYEHGKRGAITPMAVAYAHRAPIAPPPPRRNEKPPLQFHPSVAYGRLETLICADCGFTLWYAHSFHPDEWVNLPQDDDGRSPCPGCLKTQCWYVSPVEEQGGDGEPTPLRAPLEWASHSGDAKFSARVCAGCGRLRWTVNPVDVTNHFASDPCGRCGHRERCRIASVSDDGSRWNGVLRVHAAKAIGKWTAEACVGCHHIDWFASHFEKLSAADSGVELVERQTRLAGGPYR